MGYTTDFQGRFKLSEPLTVEQKNTLDEFADTRHGGNTEVEAGKPGFWCQWRPTQDGEGLEWDGGEKFYNYTEWLNYIVENFLKPWGLTLNGTVHWRGEEFGDNGKIEVDNNVITPTAV